MTFPILTSYYPVGFPLFLYLLAIIGAGAARWWRSGAEEEFAGTPMVDGVCLVVWVLSLLFGAVVGGPLIASTDNPTPLAINGATGIVFLASAWWLLDHQSARLPASA